ncbi:MAG: hypothetical protein N3D11_12195, partial [Candidatus Sumerlaeia bacterium]|nr:hypothetical protein [Candidatus Sumerlaeia bacterium]
LVYIVVIGWAFFLAALYNKLRQTGTQSFVRRRLAIGAAVCLFAVLAAIHIAHGLDWRRAFAENRRLIGEMAAFAGGQPADARYAVLAWPFRHGVALSNRPDTAAKALSILAGIPAAQSDGLLAPDAPRGTFTFEVVEKWQERRRRPGLKLRIGRIEAVERRLWVGRDIEQWQPWQNAQLAHQRSDGARDYWFLDRSAGLLSPALDMGGGYYSIQLRYEPVRLYWGFVMWRDGPEGFDPARMAPLKPLGRLGRQTQVACPGRLRFLHHLLFLPSQSRCVLTLRSIELARFEIAPLL